MLTDNTFLTGVKCYQFFYETWEEPHKKSTFISECRDAKLLNHSRRLCFIYVFPKYFVIDTFRYLNKRKFIINIVRTRENQFCQIYSYMIAYLYRHILALFILIAQMICRLCRRRCLSSFLLLLKNHWKFVNGKWNRILNGTEPQL